MKIPKDKVPTFSNEFEFLSNMYFCNVNGYSCSESMYQAEKCELDIEKRQFKNLNGYQAKRRGKKVKLRKDWDDVKIDIMRKILHIKFQGELLEKLKSIEGEIVERNYWKDTFWGVYNGVGENWLGKLLMEIRDEK